MTNIYEHSLQSIDGKNTPLSTYAGKVLLVVNVASKCGLTPQYEGLEALYREFKDAGLVVLGVPCNQFMGQEPGTDAEIQSFCSLKYDVSFPLFSKIEVNGANAHPLYQSLKAEATQPDGPGEVSWNFAKFLIDRQGNVSARFAPKELPTSVALHTAVENALAVSV